MVEASCSADQTIEFVGKMLAPFRLADREGLLGAVIGRAEMIGAAERVAELLAVGDHAADRDAAEADAVIAALAADEAHARGVAAHVMIGERDLERGVDRLGAGIAEEHMVEIAGRQRGDAARQFEGLRVAELEGRREIHFRRLLLDRGDDRLAVMAGIGAPQAGRGVEDLAAFRRGVMHVLGAGEQARPRLEGAVGRERHPEGFEVVRNAGGGDRFGRCHGLILLLQRAERGGHTSNETGGFKTGPARPTYNVSTGCVEWASTIWS